MVYKLASRYNTGIAELDQWPAILDSTFTKFGNTTEQFVFKSEDEIFGWLENNSRVRESKRETIKQTFTNGDPSRIYAVYYLNDMVKDSSYIYIYQIRLKKLHEANSTYRDESGERRNSSFKKINIMLHNISDEQIEYSSDVRNIGYEYFEGIYPLELNNNSIEEEYLMFVNEVNDLELNGSNNEEYVVSYLTTLSPNSWMSEFLKKLKRVQTTLQYFKQHPTQLDIEPQHVEKIKFIIDLLDHHQGTTYADMENDRLIKNLVSDPLFFDGQVYQLRYNNSLLTWHRNLANIIETYRLVPSKQFCDLIMNFDISQFYLQLQPDQNLQKIIDNLQKIYGVVKQPTIMVASKQTNRYQIKRVSFAPK
jgi:hypothetical protein